MTRYGRVFVVMAVSLAASTARADDIDPTDPCVASPTCHGADVDFWYEDAAFDGVDWDTGWVPASSPVQVRFGLRVLGLTEIGMGGRLETMWPDALTMTVPGRDGAGVLAIAYGIELVARIKIDVVVLGSHYVWEGDLPDLADVPTDFLMADTAAFDPFVLPGADPRPIAVADTTDRVPVYTLDITGGLIPIPGITGELRVEAEGGLEARYRSESIAVAHLPPIVDEGGATLYPAPAPDGFGAGVDVSLHPEGVLDYTGTITLYPHLEVSILGIDIIDEDLLALPLDLLSTGVDIAFDPADRRVPLPDVVVDTGALSVSDDDAEPVRLAVANAGEAGLGLTPTAWPESIELVDAPAWLDPGGGGELALRVAASHAGTSFEDHGELVLATTDPDTPEVRIALTASGHGPDGPGDPDDPDGDPDDPDGPGAPVGGCGCAAPADSSPGGGALLLVVVCAVAIGRRRLSARSRRSPS